MKNKKKKKVISMILVTLIVCQISSISVKADGYVCDHGYYTLGDYILNGGVGNYGYTNRYYWIDSDFSSTYTTYIKNAVSQWVNTTTAVGVTTPISIVYSSDKDVTVFDVYSTYLGATTFGKTEFYKRDVPVELNSNGALPKNYGYTFIHINPTALNASRWGVENVQKQATIAHEFGHAMGLSHNNTDETSIMCQYQMGFRTAVRASAEDLRAINHLY